MRTAVALILLGLSISPFGCTVQGDGNIPITEGNWKVVPLELGSTSSANDAILINTRTGETWQRQNGVWNPMKRQ